MVSIVGLFSRKYLRLSLAFYSGITAIRLKLKNIEFGTLQVLGYPRIDVSQSGKIRFGNNLKIISSSRHSMLGKPNSSKIFAANGAILTVGDNVGMSNITIIAFREIKIGHNVLLGGGVTIVDTDFHSLNPLDWNTVNDVKNMKKESVKIGDNVFIGMDCIVLKGVTIGNNVIIAAGSVVTRSIPSNQIWGGNPAAFIKNN